MKLISGIAFRFPYRIVFAVATQDSVLFYDSQQTTPFAMVSHIHYLRLTDLSWSPDGRMLIVSSTDGFTTFITFGANEIGVPYDGPTYVYEEQKAKEESSSPVSNKSQKPVPMEVCSPEADKAKPKVMTPSIKSFFKPSAEAPTLEIVAKPLTNSSENQNKCQPLGQKQASKTPNILIPRKKVKLTPVETKRPIETIELN